ncbi:MAG: GNAT family N-acetyltransferase [Bacteroidota bacterium]
MEIQRFTIGELVEWIHSDPYSQLPVVPISRARALSYLHNPRGSLSAPICYLAWEKNELVGFRTLLVDAFYKEENPQTFAWLSGVWISPKHRRKGIASTLLEAVWQDWEGSLMTTHNSPASREVYLKSGQFQRFFVNRGRRYYTRFALHRLLAPKHEVFRKNTALIEVGDKVLNFFHDRKFLILRFWISVKNVAFKAFTDLEPEWEAFVNQHTTQSLTQRGAIELKWMGEFPWVYGKQDSSISKQVYPFSEIVARYQRIYLGLYDPEGKPQVLMVLLKVGPHLTIPFFFAKEMGDSRTELEEDLRSVLLYYVVHWKCDFLTLYHQPLIEILDKVKGVFLYKKVFEEVYLASNSLIPELPPPESLTWQDGEGDVGFTG